MYGDPDFRPPASVVDEVDALSDRGVRNFRIGRQADIPPTAGTARRQILRPCGHSTVASAT